MAHRVWHDLYQKMIREKGFNLSLLSPDILESQFEKGASTVRPNSLAHKLRKKLPIGDDEVIVAHGALRDSKVPWWKEIAQIWVDPEHRGNGLRQEMVYELMARAPPGIKFFCITTDEPFMNFLITLYFRPVTQRSAGPGMRPRAWAKYVGLGGVRKRLPVTVMRKTFPKPRQGERWLFIRF